MPQPRVRLHQIPLLILLLLVAGGETRSQTFTSLTTGSPVTETGAWRSVNWVDYDRDGDLDLFVTRGLNGGQDNVLFRNDGGPGFSFTRMSGLVISQDHRSSDGSTWGDYDNDGYPDAFAVNWYNQNNLLYHNDGNGAFTRILAGPTVNDGGYSEAASWGDYNNDGLVDLYVANSGGSKLNFLYKNSGNGLFVKIAAGRQSTDVGTSRGVSWVDYDGDGDLDLFVANESNENEFLYRNMLVESGVDTFQRVTTGPLVSAGGASWSGSWADYDNDGDQDVFVANWSNQASRLYVNDGTGTFAADTASPIFTDIGYGASAGWGDFDNDGDLDLIVTHAYSGPPTTNFLYKNMLVETDTARLERVLTGPVVTDAGFMYGTSWGDYDGDGDLDLFVARTQGENQVNAFYRNDLNAGHWLTLDLRGTPSNASGIGAKVRAKAVLNGTPRWQMRVVEGQSGYCGQNLQLHFGLADAATVDSLVIEWPSGNMEIFTGVAADRHLVVVENDSTPITHAFPGDGYLNQGPTIPLRWNRPLHYPPYRLQVSTDSSFGGGMLADTLAGADTSVVLTVTTNPARYYWRISPERSIHGPIWSAVRSFDNDVQVPEGSGPISPADSAVNIPVSTQLRWGSAARATGYRVRLSSDSTFGSTQLDTVVSDTALGTGALSHLTRWFWDVRPENFVGAGPVSSVRTFTTIIQAPSVPAHLSPSPGEANVIVPTRLRWLAADRAASYQVQVDAESLFVPPYIRDTLLADTVLLLPNPGSYKKIFWRVRSFNAGGQSTYSAFEDFRTEIAAPALLHPPDGSSQFADLTLLWSPSPPAETFRLQYGTDSTFSAVVFDDSTLTDTSLSITSLQTNLAYYWRAMALHGTGPSRWSAGRSFVTTPDTFTYTAAAVWNLISLPGDVPDRSASALFPGAPAQPYGYDGVYVGAETLAYGRGYWMRLPPSAEYPIAGTKRFRDSIGVSAGWNLVGAISEPLAVTAIATDPPGLTSSPFFGYAGGFRPEDTLRPGQGYWIRMGEAGTLLLDASPSFTASNGLRVVPDPGQPPPPPGERIATVPTLPLRTALEQNYPNPFNPATTIRFQTTAGGDVRIDVYNAIGELVATLADGYRDAGYHSLTWSARGRPSGLYFVRMRSGGFSDVRQMLLMR